MDSQKKQQTPRRPSEPPKQAELSLKATSLFKLDINYDYLKTYLENIQVTLERDRDDIDLLKRLLGQKALSHTLAEDYQGFAESMALSDKELLNDIQDVSISYNQSISSKNKGVIQGPYEKAVIDVRTKLYSQSHIMQQLYNANKKQELRLSKLEREIDTKIDSKECKQKLRKMKNNFEKNAVEAQQVIKKELTESEQRLQQDILKFEESVRDVERKTLWKIHDCQDLLSKRINEEFVLDSIAASEDKLLKEIQLISGGELTQKIQQDVAFVRGLVQALQDTFNDKQQKLKQHISDLSDQLKGKSMQMDKMAETSKGYSDRISDLSNKLVNAINRLDLSYQMDQQSTKIRQLEDTVDRMNEEQRKRMESLKDMNLNAENIGFLLSKIDPHKICSLEGDIKKLEEMSIRNQVHWETLDTEFKNKFDTFNFFQQLQKAQNASTEQPKEKMITKDEILKLMNERLGSVLLDEEKFKKMQKEISEMGYKIENASEIERRVTRIFKDLDINNLIKQVKQKAGEEEVKKEFLIIETRLGQTMETVSNLRREMESMHLHLKKSNSFYANSAISPPTDNPVGINTKKLYPISCLSCTVSRDTNGPARVRGNDGKMYKADLNRTVDHITSQDTDEHQYQSQIRASGVNVTVGALMNKFQNKRPISAKK